MTPKEKAIELVDRFFDEALPDAVENDFHTGVLCALIAVDEIIPIVGSYEDALSASQKSDELTYWEEVKQEIKKL